MRSHFSNSFYIAPASRYLTSDPVIRKAALTRTVAPKQNSFDATLDDERGFRLQPVYKNGYRLMQLRDMHDEPAMPELAAA